MDCSEREAGYGSAAAWVTISQEELKSLLEYDKETGLFCWKTLKGNRKAGWFAGSPLPNGYMTIRLNNTTYYSHRLAWVYENGVEPEYIDHKNQNRTDNRLENLRL